MKQRRRRDKNAPVIGGVVNQGFGDTTKQGRRRGAQQLQEEFNERVRQDIKIPTTKEVLKVAKTKES